MKDKGKGNITKRKSERIKYKSLEVRKEKKSCTSFMS